MDGKTNDAAIEFEYVRPLKAEDEAEAGRERTPRSKKGARTASADPVMDAVRRHWTVGMSARKLHSLLQKERIKVSRERVGKLISELQGWTALSNRASRRSA